MNDKEYKKARKAWAQCVLANSREYYENQLAQATTQEHKNYHRRLLKNWDTAASEFPEIAEETRAFYEFINKKNNK